ncbi:hypothetical protein A1O7_02608 [Cladophialophora yegresii CBS 114405]|uniref:Uncharacterized protein n=1 Tax=Cladophialophora yegresii CBS 114405 TaxID=1182544 RepID=W9WB11_9EURO|nr:uncharacterized protein A1O7_02608 [Cladophialophora yegresii CBS 114405]EXJ62175.1 hypothetical protein A1O7_02608 [Cladophialophora yegresii CBS 114405]
MDIRNGDSHVHDGADGSQTPEPDKVACDDDVAPWEIKADMWRRVSMMVLDRVKPEYGDRWARNVGFEQAWETYPLSAVEKGGTGMDS